MKKLLTITAALVATLTASATDYYLSPTGSDTNDGLSETSALATIKAAQQKVVAGDKVYILPGTYTVRQDEITETVSGSNDYNTYSIVYKMTKSGSEGSPISYIGVTRDNSRPVFDFSNVKPGTRVTAFLVSCSYIVFRNFEVTGVQMTLTTTQNTQSECIRVTDGKHNTFDNVACHDTQGIGFYLTRRSSHNLFLNCDAYNNYDPNSQNGRGGNCDGFGCHVMEAAQVNNIFIGCRAWNNSDDGFDLINCYAPVTFCYSFAYRNGYALIGGSNVGKGDGNGFKAGGYGMSASAITLPTDGAPCHRVYHCIASTNKTQGVYSNHHLGGVYFAYNTAISNGGSSYYNYSLVNRKGAGATENTDVNGYGHEIRNNLSVKSGDKHVTWLDGSDGQNTIEANSFTWENNAWVNAGAPAFESTNVDRIVRARKADGMLSDATLTYCKQNSYSGCGADFSGYEAAIVEAKKISGAELPAVTNTYINDSRTWDFSDLTDGTIEKYTDYDGLILRGTADTHAITTKQGSVSFAGNGDRIESYLANNKEAADNLDATNYDRCLAFNASVAGTTAVTFSASQAVDGRYFQIFFKAKDKAVQKKEVAVAKSATQLSLTSAEAGSFFIAATYACTVHEVKFETGSSGISEVREGMSDERSGCYDLLGRMVCNPTKGLYIKNGKKIFINK